MNPHQKVIVVSDGKHGPAATQKISFGQPFAADDGSGREIVFVGPIPKPSVIKKTIRELKPDIVVLSRYTRNKGPEWAQFAHDAGIPVIYHIDDDLLSVPKSLGKEKYEAYNKPEKLQSLRDTINACDLLYVSTPALAERFKTYDLNVPTVAGDIYCSVDPDAVGALVGHASGPVFGYMGTGGHSADLAMVLPAICELLDQVPALQFELFGTIDMPEALQRFGRRVRHIPPVTDYNDFIPYLRSLGWWIGLAPLEDNSFNRCKADTKWVEYTLAGMVTIASDLPVYHRACADGAGVLVRTPEEWYQALTDLLYDPAKRQAMLEAAQTKLREQYNHAALRAQIERVFETARGPKHQVRSDA